MEDVMTTILINKRVIILYHPIKEEEEVTIIKKE